MPLSSRELRPGVAVRETVFPGQIGLPIVHPTGAEAPLTRAGESAGGVHGSALNPGQQALPAAPRCRMATARVRLDKWAR